MKILFEEANKNGISLSENQLEKFKIYMDFLIEYNSHTNLTAIKNPEDIDLKDLIEKENNDLNQDNTDENVDDMSGDDFLI